MCLLRKLVIALLFLSLLIPLVVSGFQGPKLSVSLENLQRDAVSHAEEEQEQEIVPIKKQVIVTAPENEGQQSVVKTEKYKEKQVIVIDPGHQRYADYRLERVGPKSQKWMPKMPASTYGVATGQAEYDVTLNVAKYLQKQLKAEGYIVKLTRTENVIAMSTKERADFAKKNKAALYIQLHADGLTNPKAQGLYVISPSKNNPFTKKTYKESQNLAQSIVLTAKESKVKVYKSGKIHSDSLSALNWAVMPSVLVELGYLNNPQDDARLAKKSYQMLLAKSISQGIKKYDLH